jgi:Na+/proline symporter
MLSYFGTDQSQVQRYLSGKSMKEMQMGLIFNGLLKVPMQFFILLVGVMVFVFYQFNPAPLNFIDASTQKVLASEYGEQYQALQLKQNNLFHKKKEISLLMAKENNKELKNELFRLDSLEKVHRQESKYFIKRAIDTAYAISYDKLNSDLLRLEQNGNTSLFNEKKAELTALYNDAAKDTETNDRDYMFITFILNHLPKGLIGLLLAVILSAAMSSTASEINALATITSIDLYGRNLKEKKDDKHMVKATKYFTLFWGIVAIIIACFANLAENLIQLVNIIGSIFYGNVLGIFLLAFFFKFIRGNAVFMAALITQVIVIVGWWFDWMPYLWLNLFGCLLVITIAISLQSISKKQ